ncbi:hypothetical protein [Thermoproteus uzoniensis]|uniref:hypothetical protein n=1 Tax=Thermoproteus uzoniensis TaxID=184117 RepID=UPI001F206C79|nr:hypothetical protein [Thermoproteus uzoniensis]
MYLSPSAVMQTKPLSPPSGSLAVKWIKHQSPSQLSLRPSPFRSSTAFRRCRVRDCV